MRGVRGKVNQILENIQKQYPPLLLYACASMPAASNTSSSLPGTRTVIFQQHEIVVCFRLAISHGSNG